MSNDKRITEIRVAPDAKITKGMTYSGPGFFLPSTLVLEDGSEFSSSITARRKKDVMPRLDRDRANAANGSMTAAFVDGKFFGTSTKYTMGSGRMVPITP